MNETHVTASAAYQPSLLALGEFVASVQHLPLFTGIAVQLIQSVERDDVTAEELSRLISTDAALSVQLLRMVNSPHYGLSRRVGTVANAISVMGLNRIRRTVTAAVMQRPLSAYLHDSQGVRSFWRHQLLCASLARHLNVRKGGDGELAYMSGLLHDVGRLAMVMKFPHHADTMLEHRVDDDHAVILWERNQFGFDHALVGAALLEIWNMPGGMVLATGQHANRTEPELPMVASVWNANQLAHHLVDDPEGEEKESDMRAFGLYRDVRKKIVEEVAALESGM